MDLQPNYIGLIITHIIFYYLIFIRIEFVLLSSLIIQYINSMNKFIYYLIMIININKSNQISFYVKNGTEIEEAMVHTHTYMSTVVKEKKIEIKFKDTLTNSNML